MHEHTLHKSWDLSPVCAEMVVNLLMAFCFLFAFFFVLVTLGTCWPDSGFVWAMFFMRSQLGYLLDPFVQLLAHVTVSAGRQYMWTPSPLTARCLLFPLKRWPCFVVLRYLFLIPETADCNTIHVGVVGPYCRRVCLLKIVAVIPASRIMSKAKRLYWFSFLTCVCVGVCLF